MSMLSSFRPYFTFVRSISVTCTQCGKVGKHKKPRWIPVAPSKKFILPPQDKSPEAEKNQYDLLWDRYREHYSAVSQFLWEEHLRNSEVGEAAKQEVVKELEEQDRLIRDNDEENAKVAEKRRLRLAEQAVQEERAIKERLEKERIAREERIKSADAFVALQASELENRVTPENLLSRIEEALDSPVDYEYAIDKEGHIYRGRYTKSVLIPPEDKEKIPSPERPDVYTEVYN